MRTEIIKTIKKTAKCDVGRQYCEIQNPEEVADAVLKVIFGENVLEIMKGKIDTDKVAKRFNKKHRSKKMVKAKK